MTLYFFVNYLVREYMNRYPKINICLFNLPKKTDVITIFPEWESYKDDSHIRSIEETNEIINGRSKITNDIELTSELSKLILLEANESGISENKRFLYCELLYINREINDLVKYKHKLKPKHLRYLFIVYYHYVLDNPLVMLARDLMVDQEFYMCQIKRIFNYPCFRGWVDIREELKQYRTYSAYEAHSTIWYETSLYECFRTEVYSRSLTMHFTEKTFVERIRSSSKWEIIFHF